MRILVVRLSSLGDVARLLPFLRASRAAHPGHRFDLTVEDRFMPLLRVFPSSDGVLPYPRRAGGHPLREPRRFASALTDYFGALRAGRYDLAVDLHGILRSALVARASGSRVTAGYAKGFGREGSHLLYRIPVTPAPTPRISRLERYRATLELLGLGGAPAAALEPELPAEALAERDRFLGEAGLKPGGYALLFLGTSRAQAHKRWPAEHFARLAGLLRERYGVPALLGWGPDEAEEARELAERHPLRLLPETDLAGLTAFIAGARAFAGADTGSTHVAALMGIPTVSILGPTDPVLNAPFGGRARVVWKEGILRACRGGACDHRDCMGRISAEEVADALSAAAGL